MVAQDSAPPVVHSVVSILFGGFFMVLGLVGYLAVTYTGCFTFDFSRPVWMAVKTKLFFVNIIIPVVLALGAGFILSAFLGLVLKTMGMDSGMADFLPVMLMIGCFQAMQLWVLIWSPMERLIIERRLAPLGIKPEQLRTAVLVGLSNPASCFTKRFAAIEEDIGALWVGPEQLIYWGDGEQFGISREQIVEIERKADNRSTTVLGGIAHIILHVGLPDDSVRQIRLHMEGVWTMGQKRRTMDSVADAITKWHSGVD